MVSEVYFSRSSAFKIALTVPFGRSRLLPCIGNVEILPPSPNRKVTTAPRLERAALFP